MVEGAWLRENDDPSVELDDASSRREKSRVVEVIRRPRRRGMEESLADHRRDRGGILQQAV